MDMGNKLLNAGIALAIAVLVGMGGYSLYRSQPSSSAAPQAASTPSATQKIETKKNAPRDVVKKLNINSFENKRLCGIGNSPVAYMVSAPKAVMEDGTKIDIGGIIDIDGKKPGQTFRPKQGCVEVSFIVGETSPYVDAMFKQIEVEIAFIH